MNRSAVDKNETAKKDKKIEHQIKERKGIRTSRMSASAE